MDIDETIPMRLRRAYLTIHRNAQEHFSQFGVTVDQYVLLSVVADEEGVIQSEISRRMASDINTVGAMLKLLEEEKLIRRTRCPDDGRARRVYLTAKGAAMQKKLLKAAEAIHEAIDHCISKSSKEKLLHTLDQICAEMTRPTK
ncbi:HTH-type transcriptional regulator MgrA [Crateriforma conspicua]|uniref:HTH-type transcriptional regulator MgrA n=1 Tax=Crateriforma conspicua TaxID=2527996 RepID=A0A5C6FPR6_9PLAN|nr:MarR family transcriptional regulator [Crateriforma conspicua]TWU62628.1 HTH-type transcriptional regulator MgrA [Crateriforma conspicua]